MKLSLINMNYSNIQLNFSKHRWLWASQNLTGARTDWLASLCCSRTRVALSRQYISPSCPHQPRFEACNMSSADRRYSHSWLCCGRRTLVGCRPSISASCFDRSPAVVHFPIEVDHPSRAAPVAAHSRALPLRFRRHPASDSGTPLDARTRSRE